MQQHFDELNELVVLLECREGWSYCTKSQWVERVEEKLASWVYQNLISLQFFMEQVHLFALSS